MAKPLIHAWPIYKYVCLKCDESKGMKKTKTDVATNMFYVISAVGYQVPQPCTKHLQTTTTYGNKINNTSRYVTTAPSNPMSCFKMWFIYWRTLSTIQPRFKFWLGETFNYVHSYFHYSHHFIVLLQIKRGARWPSGLGRWLWMATGHSRPGSTPTAGDFEFGTLAIPLTLLCQCLSDETLKAVGPFYLVSMPGEVKDPTSPPWNV